jgi:dTDP-4-dehydrorhamnose reductase
MRIFLTGADGMLASDIIGVFNSSHSIYGIDINGSEKYIQRCDIRDYALLHSIMAKYDPDIVLHLAAETDLERCESDPSHAEDININGTQNIARICGDLQVPLLYVSTASIFPGEKSSGYVEDDIPGPINVYSRTKLEAERIVRRDVPKNTIVRLGWAFGGMSRDKKFVPKVIHALAENKEVKAVVDKSGTLSYTMDVAKIIFQLVIRKQYGIFHVANSGIVSRYEIAQKIHELMGGSNGSVVPTTTNDFFAALAPRPKYEAIVDTKLRHIGITPPPCWDESLSKYVKQYLQNLNSATNENA